MQLRSGVAMWPWDRPAAAAPIQPIGQELPYTAGAAVKRKKKKENYSSPKRNGVLMHTITSMNLENIMLSERCETQRSHII